MTRKSIKEPKIDKFSITITDDNGKMSVEILDYTTKSKILLEEDEVLTNETTSLGWQCKYIIDTLKPAYRKLAQKK